ncbi:MAG: hypothetical protein WBV94_07190 [Blastocatellia bacterium]
MDNTLKNMKPSDQILIRTQNSEYRFSIVDPVERKGTLSGGFLGDQSRDAVLVGTLSDNDNSNSLDNVSNGLKTGRRALFYLSAKNGIERLITSIITGITRNDARKDERQAA